MIEEEDDIKVEDTKEVSYTNSNNNINNNINNNFNFNNNSNNPPKFSQEYNVSNLYIHKKKSIDLNEKIWV